MKRILFNIILMLSLQATLVGCTGEDELELGPSPTQADAEFTFEPSTENDNILVFTNTSSDAFIRNWDFGNGNTAQGKTVTATYPLKGSYEVTLTVYTDGGSVSSTQTINIAETDVGLLDLPVYNMLTGGADNPDGKTWVVAANTAGHFGLGPPDGNSPSWYAAAANEKEGSGMYDDTYTFILEDFQFDWETNGEVYLNSAQASNFAGAYESPVGDYTAPYVAAEDLTWTVTEDPDGTQYLSVSDNAFIGYYTGVSTYEIVTLTENEMFLRFIDTSTGDYVWYIRLVPEGFTVPPPPTSSLPITFEGTVPPFNGFGGTVYEVVDNPAPGGINTSSKVGKYVKGFDGNWAGIETTLDDYLDFSTNTLIKYKVYSPVAGKALFKLESADGTATAIEVFADVTKVNEWEELTFDFSAAPSGTYDKIAMFLDFDNNNGGTFYIDDIRQESVPTELTEADLTGGDAKSWKLKPAAGSFGVGPGKGNISWWPGAGTDISGDRPCLFNDQYVFKSGGVYEYKTNGDVFGEPYMGINNTCTDESALDGTNAEPWKSGTHSFSFTPATDTEPAYITVTGTGAFIALAKAYNGGEYGENAVPTADASVTYEVLDYVKTASTETLTIAVHIGGEGYWNFVLVAE